MGVPRPDLLEQLAVIISELNRSVGLRREEFANPRVDVFNEPDPRIAAYKARVVHVPDWQRAEQWCSKRGLKASSNSAKTRARMLKILRHQLRRKSDPVPSDVACFVDKEFY